LDNQDDLKSISTAKMSGYGRLRQLYSSCQFTVAFVDTAGLQKMRWLKILQDKWQHNPILDQNQYWIFTRNIRRIIGQPGTRQKLAWH